MYTANAFLQARIIYFVYVTSSTARVPPRSPRLTPFVPHNLNIVHINGMYVRRAIEPRHCITFAPPPLQKSITYGLWCCIINLMLLETCDPPASQTWHSSQIPDGGLMWRGETSAEGDIRAEVSKIFTGGCIPSISPTPPPCQHTISVFARKRLRSVHVSVPKTVHRICIVSNTNNY